MLCRASMKASSLLPLLACMTISCTGLTFGENVPGEDTFVDTPELPSGETATGSIAVDERTETIYVQRSLGSSKHLLAVDPDTGSVNKFADLTGHRDTRILFPQDRILVMAEKNDRDTLSLYDADSLALLREQTTQARYHGTRSAPGGSHVVVADTNAAESPLHVINTETLQAQVILHDGFWLEAMWLNQSDEVFAIVFYDQETPHARLLSWKLEELEATEFGQGPDGLWLNPHHDILLPDAKPDFLFSFTWVGVAPDDSKVVLPMQRVLPSGDYEKYLVIFDTESETTEEISDALGPVGFTPDSSTIVSYRYNDTPDGGQESALLLIDVETHEQTELPLPTTDLPNFFVTREGNFVVVASALGSSDLVLFDLDSKTQTTLEGQQLSLREFVSRLGHHELWLVDEGLFLLDVMAGFVSEVPLPWQPEHINVLPTRDRLVLDDGSGDALHLYDPEAMAITKSFSLKTYTSGTVLAGN